MMFFISILLLLASAAVHAQQICRNPISADRCGPLMARLTQNQINRAANCQSSATGCYNFCGGILQNCDANYFPGLCMNPNIVAGCRMSDAGMQTTTTTMPMMMNTNNNNVVTAAPVVRTTPNGAENMVVNPNPRLQATVTVRNPNGGVQQQTTNRFGGGTTSATSVSSSTTTTRNTNMGLNSASFFNPQVRVNGVTTTTTATARPGISFPNSLGGSTNTNMNANTMNTARTNINSNQGTFIGPRVAVNQAAGRTTALGVNNSGSSRSGGRKSNGKRKRASVTTVSQRAEATSGHRSKGGGAAAFATAAAAGLAVLAAV